MKRINDHVGMVIFQVTALCILGPIFGALCFVLATGRLK